MTINFVDNNFDNERAAQVHKLTATLIQQHLILTNSVKFNKESFLQLGSTKNITNMSIIYVLNTQQWENNCIRLCEYTCTFILPGSGQNTLEVTEKCKDVSEIH